MTDPERPLVTVVIPMLNEDGYIGPCVEGFLAQTYGADRLEILVMDGGSTDGSRETVAALAEQHPQVRLVENPKRLAAAAANVGIAEASGEILCFLSAHGVPDPDYVATSVRLLQELDAVGVGGRYLHVGTDPRSRAVGLAMASPFGMASPHRSSGERGEVDTISHPTFLRQALIDVGGYDETLLRNEDYELNYRLRRNGGPAGLLPGDLVGVPAPRLARRGAPPVLRLRPLEGHGDRPPPGGHQAPAPRAAARRARAGRGAAPGRVAGRPQGARRRRAGLRRAAGRRRRPGAARPPGGLGRHLRGGVPRHARLLGRRRPRRGRAGRRRGGPRLVAAASPVTDAAPAPAADERAGGWEHGVASRLTNLAAARVVAQVVGLGWFLYVARQFGARDFGVLSSGLALVIVIGGLSDLGTTRTVVRHVAADRASLRPTFARAAGLRAGAGALVGVVAAVAMHAIDGSLPVAVVGAAALVAAASGITEIGFAALRSVGLVGAEVGLLVGERLAFVVLAGALVVAGGGPVAVLGAYAATNLLSALAVTWQVARHGRGPTSPAGALLDREGRRTALSSTLVIVGPRISVLILLLASTPTVLGAFTIAQKVPEALGTLGTAALMPVLPLLREALVGGRWDASLRRAGRIAATVGAAIAPPVVLLCVDGRRVVDVLFDAGHRSGVVAALGFLAVVALLWVIRTLGEMVLLAEERASAYLRALVCGLVANVAVGVPLVSRWGASGAAGAALVGEVVVLVVVAASVRSVAGLLARPLAAVVAAAAAGGVVAVAGRHLPVLASGALTAAVAGGALLLTGRSILDRSGRSALAAPGDDADVGAQVRWDLGGDGVETVEHGPGPSQHL
ncbi:glycosyltransferase [Aquihabitans sp. G128]|uniref:glycosyltransferase n=1 Tax=Aquihabitans sp. G128 TaxID=2849779 RepID=UPI001C23AA50|nr:glycosyltransferase [Aquihabitans sp. G128]QXC61702.1 glycosyltransferase [Aquihabitans sp. G128]